MANKVITYQIEEAKIIIDRNKCISCGLCAELAPKTFELDDEMISTVKEKPHDTLAKIKEAASSCATQAITVE
jgi:ferredoxin